MSARVTKRVLTAFEEWAVTTGELPEDPKARDTWLGRARLLLEGRATYLGRPDPTLWRSGDVHALFMDHLVSRQYDGWGFSEHAVELVAAYLRFLDETGLLHPGSTRVATLLKELHRLAPGFPAAMEDRGRWRLAKTVFTQMQLDGLDVPTATAEVMDAWAEKFNQRDVEARRAVLGHLADENPQYLTGRLFLHEGLVAIVPASSPMTKADIWPDACSCDGGCGCAEADEWTVDPVVLGTAAELADDVADSGTRVLRPLLTLVRALGVEGLPVDKHGRLRGKDLAGLAAALHLPDPRSRESIGSPLDQLWHLALEFDVVRLQHGRAVPGAGVATVEAAVGGDGPAEERLAVWTDVCHELVRLAAEPLSASDLLERREELRHWLDPWVPRTLGLLLEQGPDGRLVDFDALMDAVQRDLVGPLDPRANNIETLVVFAHVAVRRALADLERHGVLDIERPSVNAGLTGGDGMPDLDAASVEELAGVLGVTPWELSGGEGARIRLTPLGRHAVRERLVREGVAVPVAG